MVSGNAACKDEWCNAQAWLWFIRGRKKEAAASALPRLEVLGVQLVAVARRQDLEGAIGLAVSAGQLSVQHSHTLVRA